jgi:hypothetical protein
MSLYLVPYHLDEPLEGFAVAPLNPPSCDLRALAVVQELLDIAE